MDLNPKDSDRVSQNPASDPKGAALGQARADLLRLVQHDVTDFSDCERWKVGEVDSAVSRRAAVLILFGALDAEPARTWVAGNVAEYLDVLVLVRASSMRSHAGQPAFPGGKIDPEDYERAERDGVPVSHIAAVREAVEETGLDPEGVEVLGAIQDVPLPVSNFQVSPIIGWWCKPSPVDVVDHQESSLVLRVPVADLVNPANRLYATISYQGRTHRSPAFDVAQDGETFRIWGFTGVILDRVLDALGWSVPWDQQRSEPAPIKNRKRARVRH
ncbi:CoA pyrophosphatase [Rothia sp. ZJ1223]|uniref:NUDIX hydrolase n=1 Tax=Rothia sp. ZJ1223 TaxID=2811098 RepID=UPI001EF47853|nr:CoA pyrophosphatase [Rothia sp. ZJ1223]